MVEEHKYVKPNLKNSKFTIHDWHYNNRLKIACSETQQKIALQVLAKSDQVCDFTTQIVKSNKDQSNHYLEERINEIEFCKQELIAIRNQLPLEIDAMVIYKNRLTESLTALRLQALDICKKCLSLRESRIGNDLVNDNVEKQLLKECEVIVNADNMMSETLEQTQEQLRRLKSVLYYLDHDIEDKQNNLRVDQHNSSLKETSLNLSIYNGKSSLQASCITLEEWEVQTKKNIVDSAREVKIAKEIRCNIDCVLTRILNSLKNQKSATDKAFKERIQETKEFKIKLEQQHSEIVRQANEMIRNITRLKKIIAEKEGFIALTNTRLGNRCQRPGLELTRDLVEDSLTKEVADLRKVVAQLQQTLDEAQASLRFLLKMQVQLEEDVNIKTNSLKIDEVYCMAMRERIDYHVF